MRYIRSMMGQMLRSVSHQTQTRLILPSVDHRLSLVDAHLRSRLHHQHHLMVLNLDMLHQFYLTFVV